MVGSFLTIPVTNRAQVPLVEAGAGVTLIANGDANNTIYLSDDYGAQAGQSNTTPLVPGAFLSVDGTTDVYGVCLAGQSANAYVIPGGLSFFQLVTILAKIIEISASAGNGLYVYSMAPAIGDLIASITSSPGSDPQGNITLPGIASYDPAGHNAMRIVGAQLFTYSGSEPGPWSQQSDLTLQGGGLGLFPLVPFAQVVFGQLGANILSIYKILATNTLISNTGSTLVSTALVEIQGSGEVFAITVLADTVARFQIDNNGKIQWGPGNATVDTDLYRVVDSNSNPVVHSDNGGEFLTLNIPHNSSTVAHLGVDSSGLLYSIGTVATALAHLAKLAADTNNRWTVDHNGLQSWGTGAAATDTTLGRTGVARLTTQQLDVTTLNVGEFNQGAIVTGGTIDTFTTANTGMTYVTPAAAVTGIILQVGTVAGQEHWVVNNSAFLITFAAAGSNVANGSNITVPAREAAKFVWSAVAGQWFVAR